MRVCENAFRAARGFHAFHAASRAIAIGTALELTATVMRKRYRVLVISAFVGALAAPVGYALSLEPQPRLAHTSLVNTPFSSVPDAGKLLLVGTALFGISAIVRKAR